MILKEAVKRLSFTISKGNKPNQNDVDAFNEIIRNLKLSEQETVQENLLFAKLYTFTLTELLAYYTDIEMANKEINKILSEPMAIEKLQMSLRRMELHNYFNRKKILDPFLKNKTANELEEIHERYKNKLPGLNVDEFLKCGNNWDAEAVKYNIENSINLSIKNFKNYV
jgi:hypothetical protein